MKKTLIAAMIMLGAFTSFSHTKSVDLPRAILKKSIVQVQLKNVPVYDMFLMNDGCYHLYVLGSHIDYTGMLVQGWELVDPAGYIGTTSVCLYGSNWESLC